MNGKKLTVTKIVVGVLLLCGIAGATWAFMGMITETEKNVFASTRELKIMLREPAWDGYTFEDGDDIYPLGRKGKTEDAGLGVNKARNYVPGDIISKNPTVKNLKDDAYIGLKVTYFIEGKQVTPDQLKKLASWDTDTDHWDLEAAMRDGTEFYLYRDAAGQLKLISEGETAPSLFSRVVISEKAAEEYEKMYPDTAQSTLPQFEIRVAAYAVQAEGIDDAGAKTKALGELKELAKIES